MKERVMYERGIAVLRRADVERVVKSVWELLWCGREELRGNEYLHIEIVVKAVEPEVVNRETV